MDKEHPSADELIEYSARNLSIEKARRIEEHVGDCRRCKGIAEWQRVSVSWLKPDAELLGVPSGLFNTWQN